MKYLVTVQYTTKPGKRQELWDQLEASGIPAFFRTEKGNLHYDYFLPADGNPDVLWLYELWEDRADQAAHETTPQFAQLGEILSAYTVPEKKEIHFYDATEV